MVIRPSSGSRLTRSDKTELDYDLVQAAKNSLISGEAMEATFATEREAKAVSTKLRTYVNSNGNGLRAKVAEDTDSEGNPEWVLEFKVTQEKRDVTRKN